ncbi:phage tail assembly protein [Vibrio aestuarianus]|uniref:phage tail assembly protein n=1 Tax=Vibrio aestuarianus TaxID=28171 RepID=UPI001593A19C|nr:phage tail assembly protein [Vibrio aestuarianus]NGZ18017.1 phage tail assembly protein [Vibrio aestuarianus]
MKKEHLFLEKPHTLLEAIELDDKTITQVVVKPWTAKENIKLLPKGDKLTFNESCALITAATGLVMEEIDELVTQDFNAIFSDVHEYYLKTGYELADSRSDEQKYEERKEQARAQKAGEAHEPSQYEQDATQSRVVLYFSGERVVNLKRPKIKITKMAEEFDTVIEQRIFILTQISGLSQDEVEALPLPDYRSLNEVVMHFLSSKAA